MSSPSRSTFATDVIPIVGQAVAAELVRQIGGTTFPVPKRESAQGEVRYRQLASVVGEEAADLLVYHYGGTELYIPRGARAIQVQRDAVINQEATEAIRAGGVNHGGCQRAGQEVQAFRPKGVGYSEDRTPAGTREAQPSLRTAPQSVLKCPGHLPCQEILDSLRLMKKNMPPR